MNADLALKNLSHRKQVAMSPQDRYAGIRALWLKVIIRAIFDWVCYRDSSRMDKRKLAEQAELWLFGKSQLFNSFESLCNVLDISPDEIRERARNMSKEQISKIEHLDRFGVGEDIAGAHLVTEGLQFKEE